MPGLLRQCASVAATLLLSLQACAEPWVASYGKARSAVLEACGAHDPPKCQRALLDLESLAGARLDIEYRLARVEAELGLETSALRRLEVYARSGLDLGNPAEQPAFATLNQGGSLRHIVDLYRAGLVARTAHERVVNLRDSDLIAEDIACDGEHGSFLVSSVRKRKILRVEASGRIHDFVTQMQTPLWGVFALGLDSRHNVLWATTSTANISPPVQPEDADRSAVLALDARSGALISRYELPRGAQHQFGDMTVSPTGAVYVSDGAGGGVYTVGPGRDSVLTAVVEPGELASPQTPVLSRDGLHLLVPDYVRGIALVALDTRAVTWLRHPPELAMFGIDGLYADGRTLVAVQNGTTPERIIMMHLTEELTSVDRWRVLLARARGLGDPTHGCLRGGEFTFIANSGWDQFQDDGERKPDSQPSSAEIWKIRVPTDS